MEEGGVSVSTRAAVQLAVTAGSHAGEAGEHAREVALIGEAHVRGDVGDRLLRYGQLARGEVDAQPAEVFADGAAVPPAEYAIEVRRMDASEASQVVEANVVGGV